MVDSVDTCEDCKFAHKGFFTQDGCFDVRREAFLCEVLDIIVRGDENTCGYFETGREDD